MVVGLVGVGLVVGYAGAFDGTDAYPDTAAIDANYERHVGERVHLWGTVVAERPAGVVVAFGPLRLTATNVPRAAVDPGDSVQVFGRLEPDHRITAQAYHVRTPADRTEMYGVSLLAGLLAAAGFLRRWRLDTDRWEFVPRDATADREAVGDSAAEPRTTDTGGRD